MFLKGSYELFAYKYLTTITLHVITPLTFRRAVIVVAWGVVIAVRHFLRRGTAITADVTALPTNRASGESHGGGFADVLG
jgi:hypothetical protein